MIEQDDPITRVYRGIVALLRAHPDLTERVKPGNLLDYATGEYRQVRKPRRHAADLPEVVVTPAPGGEVQPYKSSKKSHLTQNFSVLIVTGDERVDDFLFPLKFAIFRALTSAEQLGFEAEDSLPYGGRVVDTDIVDSFEDSFLTELGRTAASGWQAAFVITARMEFDRRSLQNPDI